MTYKKRKINKKMKTKKLKQFRKTKKHYKKGGGISDKLKCQREWDSKIDRTAIDTLLALGDNEMPVLKTHPHMIDCNVYAYPHNNKWYMMRNNRKKTKCYKSSEGLMRKICPNPNIRPTKQIEINAILAKKKQEETRKMLARTKKSSSFSPPSPLPLRSNSGKSSKVLSNLATEEKKANLEEIKYNDKMDELQKLLDSYQSNNNINQNELNKVVENLVTESGAREYFINNQSAHDRLENLLKQVKEKMMMAQAIKQHSPLMTNSSKRSSSKRSSLFLSQRELDKMFAANAAKAAEKEAKEEEEDRMIREQEEIPQSSLPFKVQGAEDAKV